MLTIRQEERSLRDLLGSARRRAPEAMRLVVLLTIIGALTSCLATGRGTGTSDLRGTSWELTSLSGSGLLSGTAITLDFEEEELSGSAGCNHYGASYETAGDSLSVGDIAVTEMACPDPQGVLDQEAAYLAVLGAVDSYQLTAEQLELLGENGEQVLAFVPADSAPISRPTVPPDESVVVQNTTALPSNEATPVVPAATMTPVAPTATAGPPPGFQLYEDDTAGVALLLPESWTVTHVAPGQSAILQSYPEDKYVGGEARDPADTKCDLTLRPADVDLAGHMDQVRSSPSITIVSEDEIVLASGSPGIRLELESMGPSRSLVTTVDDRVVVLTCFGELAPFDELALSIRSRNEQ